MDPQYEQQQARFGRDRDRVAVVDDAIRRGDTERPTITGALDETEKMIEMLRQGIDSLEARLQPVLGPAPNVDRGVSNGGAVGGVPVAYSVRQQIANQGHRLWVLQQQVNSLTARVEL